MCDVEFLHHCSVLPCHAIATMHVMKKNWFPAWIVRRPAFAASNASESFRNFIEKFAPKFFRSRLHVNLPALEINRGFRQYTARRPTQNLIIIFKKLLLQVRALVQSVDQLVAFLFELHWDILHKKPFFYIKSFKIKETLQSTVG